MSRGSGAGVRGSLALLLLVTAMAVAAPPAGPVKGGEPEAGREINEETVREVASRLRCVVCQNLSVADSPSEMANQMRAIVRERLVAGESPEQVIAYFVEKYGEWILLSPRPRGFNLLVWALPFAAILLGLFGIAVAARRWSRRTPTGGAEPPDQATRERIRREMTKMEE